MSSELFERNLGRLVRQAALSVDGERTSRARAGFLQATESTPSGRSWGPAVAAAALLICILVYGATSSGVPPGSRPAPISKEAQETPPSYTAVRITGGNELLNGVLKTAKGDAGGGKLRFEGRSPLPEGTVFHALLVPVANRLVKGCLVEHPLPSSSNPTRLESGGFTVEWEGPRPGVARVVFRAPDDAQEIPVLSQLKIKESNRECVFVAFLWDDGLLSRLEPQLAELSQLAADTRDLVARVEASCSSMERFKASEKALLAEARRMEARANGLSTAGLFPAAALQVAWTAGDLAASMSTFAWKDGKFEGPCSYYSDHKRGKTFRGDPFDFDALCRYLEESVLVAGREFDLWIVLDLRRGGLRPVLIEAVDRSARRPGVAEFAERLRAGAADEGLIGEIRQIAK